MTVSGVSSGTYLAARGRQGQGRTSLGMCVAGLHPASVDGKLRWLTVRPPGADGLPSDTIGSNETVNVYSPGHVFALWERVRCLSRCSPTSTVANCNRWSSWLRYTRRIQVRDTLLDGAAHRLQAGRPVPRGLRVHILREVLSACAIDRVVSDRLLALVAQSEEKSHHCFSAPVISFCSVSLR